ncbi:hypothetical protein MKW98_005103 [Papaver atlanticum]|uniref:Uncharacterized protein n=1 Tax=Papaver atlanticum TaxID=357466 RepID=A0AAD4RW67_9MAGN|nr:hypothetical protein MKW98_005103 [Papaver atlanticum]
MISFTKLECLPEPLIHRLVWKSIWRSLCVQKFVNLPLNLLLVNCCMLFLCIKCSALCCSYLLHLCGIIIVGGLCTPDWNSKRGGVEKRGNVGISCFSHWRELCHLALEGCAQVGVGLILFQHFGGWCLIPHIRV